MLVKTEMGRCTGIAASGRWVAPESEMAGVSGISEEETFLAVETVASDDTAGKGGVWKWSGNSQGDV